MNKRVRVRFAPSPTGPLNIGGLRTALYDYLFAKQHGGDFILRIEDTDRAREVEGTEQYIIDALAWAGISPDEGPGIGGDYGPYRQSERLDLYSQYTEQLIAMDKAYYAFDTSEALEAKRAAVEAEGNSFKYNHAIRSDMDTSIGMSEDQLKARLDRGDAYTVRLKIMPGAKISFDDTVREHVSFSTDEMDDKIIMKGDGMPTYHLANIVDDYLMKITHVIRGEEWLSSTPHHVFMYDALGWEKPVFSHLPLILKPVGKGKLSKRDSAQFGFPVFPLDWVNADGVKEFDGFKEAGYLPQALINFLVFLGWNPGTEQEMFSLEGLVEAFSLDKIAKAGARFDIEKAKWFSQQYLIASDNEALAIAAIPFFQKRKFDASEATISTICGLFKERVYNLDELAEAARFIFEQPVGYDEKTIRKRYKSDNKAEVAIMMDMITALDTFEAKNIESTIKGYIEAQELKFGEILPIFRIALTGSLQGPDIFDVIALLGKAECNARMSKGLAYFDEILANKEG